MPRLDIEFRLPGGPDSDPEAVSLCSDSLMVDVTEECLRHELQGLLEDLAAAYNQKYGEGAVSIYWED